MITNFKCEECPYGIESFLKRYSQLGDDYQPEYCWCDKVGGNHLMYGWCDEIEDKHEYNNELDDDSLKYESRLNQYENKIKYKKKALRNVKKSQYVDCYYDYINYFNTIKFDENGEMYGQRLCLSGKRKLCKRWTNKRLEK